MSNMEDARQLHSNPLPGSLEAGTAPHGAATPEFDADASLLPAGKPVVVALSGGPDSTALLRWLLELGHPCVGAHVHHDLHELRGGDCDRDAQFVSELCAAKNVECHILRVHLRRSGGHVNESVAREARYEALGGLAAELGAICVATGHTATDALETMLLNVMRGTTVRGLGAFAPQRVLVPGIDLIRPLWRVKREATRQFLEQGQWPWLEDASNRDGRFRRNRVRHEILPVLADISGRPLGDLAISYATGATLLRQDLQLLEEMAATALHTVTVKRQEGLVVLSGPGWLAQPAALRPRILRHAAAQAAPGAPEPGRTALENVQQSVQNGARRIVWQWSSHLLVEWTGPSCGNRIRFRRV